MKNKRSFVSGLKLPIGLLAVSLMVAGCVQSQPVEPTPGNANQPVQAIDSADNTNSSGSDDQAVPVAEKVFDISGLNFAFSMDEIRVKQGDKVTINFVSTDGFHDWVVDEFSAATEQVNTGGSTSVTFVADRLGTFEYYCSVGKHRELGMKGNLIVE